MDTEDENVMVKVTIWKPLPWTIEVGEIVELKNFIIKTFEGGKQLNSNFLSTMNLRL